MTMGTKRRMGVRAAVLEAMESRVLMSYAPEGPDLLVNQTIAGNQNPSGSYGSSIDADAAGNYVVTWGSTGQDGSGSGVYARRFDTGGSPLGGEFRVNTTTAGDQTNSAVAVSPAGNFVVVWMDNGKDGSGYGIFGQRYNSQGVVQGGEFRVNTTTAYAQYLPSLSMDDAGNFVVVWTSERQEYVSKQEPASQGIYGQRFTAAGARLGGEFHVNTFQADNQIYPTVGMGGAGDFVVAWQSRGNDGSDFGVFAQRYNAQGAVQGNEFRVNSYTAGAQTNPKVAVTNGAFVLVWRSAGQDGSGLGTYAKRYAVAPDGVVIAAPEFRVNTSTAGDQLGAAVAFDDAGNSLITWTSYPAGPAEGDVLAQEYDAASAPAGGEFVLNGTAAGKQYGGHFVFQPGGSFVTAFSGTQADGATDAFARRFVRAATPAGFPTAQPLFSDALVPVDASATQGASEVSIVTSVLA